MEEYARGNEKDGDIADTAAAASESAADDLANTDPVEHDADAGHTPPLINSTEVQDSTPGPAPASAADPAADLPLSPPPAVQTDAAALAGTDADGGGTKDPTVTALEIKKLITGNGSVKTKYFSFNVKVKQPSIIALTPPQVYKAYVLNAAGDIVTSTANYASLKTDANGKDYIEFTSGVRLQDINLTNEQRLAFADLHVGATVEAEEAAADGYIPKYQRTFAGTGEFTGAENTSWGFPRETGTEPDAGPHYLEDGNNNIATFTNTRAGATPTGIAVDDLPYIVLAGVAIAGLIGLVIAKTRKKSGYEA